MARIDTRSLDAFGRVRAHEVGGFDDSSTCASPLYELIHRYEHGYDEGGYRRHTRVTQRDIGASSRDNTHSALYTLDPLGRLQDAEVGAIDTSTYETTLAGARRERFGYGLDSLGNRVGAGSAYGYEHQVDPDGLSGWSQTVAQRDDTVSARNEVTAITGAGEPTVTLTRDEIGSVTQESGGAETRTQAYDAWGRLALWSDYDPGAGGGPHYGQYHYDGLGRLCKRSAPWPTQTSLSRVETYHHDGVRRIQEVFTDPVHAETPWADPYGTPPPPQTPQTRMEREYIWAAHEGAGVNELHVAIDWFDREAWPIQDAHNQTVMGYADAVGVLVEQRVYTPFGQILNADKTALANPGGLYNDFRLRVGFQGLFADRLDADTTAPVLRSPNARVVYLTNNRVYEPVRGSWMQRDPNASGLLTLDELPFGGQAFSRSPRTLDPNGHFADGLNLFSAYRSNAQFYDDPTGLFSALDLGGAISVQGLVGGLLGGTISAATGGSFTDGALAGAAFGAAFGGIGYGVQSAFSLTAGGLSGSLGGAGGAFGNAAFIRITGKGLGHVYKHHVAGGSGTAGKSIFSGSKHEVITLVKTARGTVPKVQQNGRYERIIDAGRTIGRDRATQQPTSVYTVITDTAGDLKTAFPGVP